MIIYFCKLKWFHPRKEFKTISRWHQITFNLTFLWWTSCTSSAPRRRSWRSCRPAWTWAGAPAAWTGSRTPWWSQIPNDPRWSWCSRSPPGSTEPPSPANSWTTAPAQQAGVYFPCSHPEISCLIVWNQVLQRMFTALWPRLNWTNAGIPQVIQSTPLVPP